MSDFRARDLGWLTVLAVLGAVAYAVLSSRVSPSASVDLRLSRAEIMRAANEAAAALGHDISGLHQDAILGFEGATQLAWQEAEGMERANAILRADSLPVHHWYVSWFDRTIPRSANRQTFQAWISPAGKLLGFERTMQDTVHRPSLSLQDAGTLAESFLRRQQITIDSYTLKQSSDARHASRVDYRFVWTRPHNSFEETVWITIQGDEVGGFRRTLDPSRDFEGVFAERATWWTFITTASFAVVFFLLFFTVILFLKKYHDGEVGTRSALLAFIGIFGMMVLQSANEFRGIGYGARIGDLNAFNVRIVLFIVNVFILQLFVGVMAFAAWSVGESSARSVWPDKLRSADAALHRAFLTREFGVSVVRGYLWGLFLIGACALVLWLLQRGAGYRTLVQSLGGLPESYLPSLSPLLTALAFAGLTEVVFRLFFLSYLRERFRTAWPGVVISTVIWTATGLVVWTIPFGSASFVGTPVTLVLFGLAFCLLFLRYDLVTSFAANFVVSALATALPLFVSTAEGAPLQQAAFIALLAFPLGLGVVAAMLDRSFTFTPETLPAHVRRISERVRMAKELEIARSVQMSLLPKAMPDVRGFDIAGICVPAQEIGGDYFDFISLGGRRLGIAVGDVSGKGVPAAIYMTLTKGILQSHAEEVVSPRDVLMKVNNLMYRTIERNSFVSMVYAVLSPGEKTIRFARAGQCPLILTQRAGDRGVMLSPRGMALGLEHGTVFDGVIEERELPLAAGDTLVLYTDGFTEAMNERSEEFGESRLIDAIDRYRSLPASEMIGRLTDEVRTFAGTHPQHDDMTMVIVKVQ